MASCWHRTCCHHWVPVESGWCGRTAMLQVSPKTPRPSANIWTRCDSGKCIHSLASGEQSDEWKNLEARSTSKTDWPLANRSCHKISIDLSDRYHWVLLTLSVAMVIFIARRNLEWQRCAAASPQAWAKAQ